MAGRPASAKKFNKFAVHLAGHRLFPLWAVLRHRGRKSGTEYSIPVAVMPTDDAFLIGLPWGRGTDWARNTVAAARLGIGEQVRIARRRCAGQGFAFDISR